jgi:hypothetical protein
MLAAQQNEHARHVVLVVSLVQGLASSQKTTSREPNHADLSLGSTLDGKSREKPSFSMN